MKLKVLIFIFYYSCSNNETASNSNEKCDNLEMLNTHFVIYRYNLNIENETSRIYSSSLIFKFKKESKLVSWLSHNGFRCIYSVGGRRDLNPASFNEKYNLLQFPIYEKCDTINNNNYFSDSYSKFINNKYDTLFIYEEGNEIEPLYKIALGNIKIKYCEDQRSIEKVLREISDNY